MATGTKVSFVSVNEYLKGERDARVRHEYVAGQLYAMTGASVYHNRIAGNFFAAIKPRLGGRCCDVFIADMKVQTDAAFYYPDLMVVCDPEDADPVTKTKPILIVEVIAANTRCVDEREKRLAYQHLASLQEYVLAEQDRAEVRLMRRLDAGGEQEIYGPDDLIGLRSLEIVIPMQALYDGAWR